MISYIVKVPQFCMPKKYYSNYFWGALAGYQRVITKSKQAMGATDWFPREKFFN